jgi:hypothetical protein
MSKINLQITYPAFIEKTVVCFLLRHRKHKYGYEFRRIKLVGGGYAKVDAEDYEKLCGYVWYIKEGRNTSYALRLNPAGGKPKIISMHREIMQAGCGTIVDHINREGLDNRKENLQFVTRSQNAMNYVKKARADGSKYRGVCKDKKRGKWRAYIHCDLKPRHLGYFASEIEAGKAYDEAAKKYHGKYAVLNFE